MAPFFSLYVQSRRRRHDDEECCATGRRSLAASAYGGGLLFPRADLDALLFVPARKARLELLTRGTHPFQFGTNFLKFFAELRQ
jgi:hypothetical protein